MRALEVRAETNLRVKVEAVHLNRPRAIESIAPAISAAVSLQYLEI